MFADARAGPLCLGPFERFAMKIAVCAWGSLIWDPRQLLVRSPFIPVGPELPIEFSHISGRHGHPHRLTLVIDPEDGVPCRTHVAPSGYTDLYSAIENLRLRAGMWSAGDVGTVNRHDKIVSARAAARDPNALLALRDWLLGTDYDTAIWAALPPNFAARSECGVDLFVDEAIRFLEGLSRSDLKIAVAYIRNAAKEVQTPLRYAARKRWAFLMGEGPDADPRPTFKRNDGEFLPSSRPRQEIQE